MKIKLLGKKPLLLIGVGVIAIIATVEGWNMFSNKSQPAQVTLATPASSVQIQRVAW